ncbi:MAG: LamB/YcsF family protein [Anaerolineae bacterium]
MPIDLNCDLGESFGHYQLGDDAAMLKIVTSANIACGLHAGDPLVMRRTVEQALVEGVAVGAHPSYPDRQGFGRRFMDLTPDEVEAYLIFQLGALAGFCQTVGINLRHVKPHGALYNVAAKDGDVAAATARAVASFDRHLIVVTQPGSALALAARSLDLRVAREGFVDRAYASDGSLVPRGKLGAVIHEPDEVAARVVRMVTRGEVETIDGHCLPINVDTLCVHGDTPGAVNLARRVRAALEEAGVTLAPLAESLAS